MKCSFLLHVVICFSFALFSSKAVGQEVVVKQNVNNDFAVTTVNYQHLQGTNAFGKMSSFNVTTDKGNFSELMVDHYVKTTVVGEPQLPILSRLIEVPVDATPTVVVKSYDVQEYKLSDLGIQNKIIPAQPSHPKSSKEQPEFIYNPDIYKQNKFFGKELVSVEIQGYLRNMRLANLIISPIQYNPVTGMLRVYSNIEFTVNFENADIQKTEELKAIYSSPYFNTYQNRIISLPSMAKAEPMTKNPVKYVIVSDPMFRQALQPFVQWKIKKGFTVIEAYTDDPNVGKTTTSIKNYLQNLYTSATQTDPAPSFILFVGDVAQIPAFQAAGHVTDLRYCEYTGDNLPEVYYGRFSATNVDELQPQIDKTLEYEQFLFPDPSFLNEVVMISGFDGSGHAPNWGNGQINYGTTYYFNQAHGMNPHIFLQPEPSGANYSPTIRNLVSAGAGYVNYTAHGGVDCWADPEFTIAQIPALQNKGKYPLMVGNCCVTGTFNQYCFGEALLRAKDKGALAYIGASNNSYWDEDYYWGVGVGPITANPTYETHGLGAYDRTFHDRGEPYSEWYTTVDQMIFAGNLAVQESSSDKKQYYWEIYHTFGDPSLSVYFSNPPALNVSYLPILSLGSETFDVQTEPYAYIGLTKNGTIYGAGQADANGKANIKVIPNMQAGYASVVITKQNRRPYIDSVLVGAPNSPYLVLKNTVVNDSQENDNQIAENNEEIAFDITFKNIGGIAATNATAVLRVNDPFVTILDSVAALPEMAKDSTRTATNSFRVKIDPYIPDQHVVTFTLVAKAGSESTLSTFATVVHAPKLVAGAIQLLNLQHPLAPGDIIDVSVSVTNTGHVALTNPVASSLASFSNYVTVLQGEQKNVSLKATESTDAKFKIQINPDCPVNTPLNLYFSASADGYNASASLFPYVGKFVEDFETGDFTKFDWKNDTVYPWLSSTAEAQQGQFSARSGAIGHNKHSDLYIDLDVFADDTLSFYVKTSSEPFDYLNFYVDGVVKGQFSGISTDWTFAKYIIPQGKHRLLWSYVKNGGTTAGQDRVWIDNIRFPGFSKLLGTPALKAEVSAVTDTVCANGYSQLLSSVSKISENTSYQWSPATGLNRTDVPNPIATPTVTTKYKLVVTDGAETAKDSIFVVFEAVPATPTITEGSNHLLTSSAATGNQWYDLQGPIAGATGQTYQPTQSGLYYTIVTHAAGCPSEPSNQISIVLGVPQSQSQILAAYPNPFSEKLTISYYLGSASKIRVFLYNALGMQVFAGEEQSQGQGRSQYTIQTANLPAGVYVCKIVTADKTMVTKVIHTK